jgi:transcription-repair coupling factor (superfamily II helicase)
VQNQQSEFYQSPFFGMLMQYLSRYPAKARLKERNNKLTLVMEQMRSIDQVVQALKQITDALQVVPEKQS